MKIRTLNDYLKETYGEKIYKIAINGGFTCPNRDGTLGTVDASSVPGRDPESLRRILLSP